MNFLAHLYLSGNNDEVKIGNFIADSVKGRDLSRYPADIRLGILLHRHIDDFTDHTPLLHAFRTVMQKEFPKYYGLLLDICFDHFLAANWNRFSNVPLHAYVRHVYVLLILNYRWLPPRARRSLPFLITQNWLESYQELQGIAKIFDRMNRYRGLPWPSKPVIAFMQKHYVEMNELFQVFFDDLIVSTHQKKQQLR